MIFNLKSMIRNKDSLTLNEINNNLLFNILNVKSNSCGGLPGSIKPYRRIFTEIIKKEM